MKMQILGQTQSAKAAELRHVHSLELAAGKADVTGGKAANLGRMIQMGLQVPPGLVITNQGFQAFLESNSLSDPIANQLARIDLEDPQSLSDVSQAISELVLASDVPERLLDAIHEQLAETLPGATLAVRSSAIGEDSAQAAFAGQLDSFLDVDSEADLRRALLACWASYWSSRSLFYQRSRGIPLQGMGVIIQEMVSSRLSGILFTRPPQQISQEPDALVAEFCQGTGEALAAGHIDPGQFLISRRRFAWNKLSSPETPADEACLFNDERIAELRNAALQLEEQFSGPQDIEWTIDANDRLYLVQSRPITTPPASAAAEDSKRRFTESKAGSSETNVVWSNANVNENFPEPISPLLYSIAAAGYANYFRNLGLVLGISPARVAVMEAPLKNIIGVHGARMYYNLTNIEAVLRAAPFGASLAEWFNSFVGVTSTSDTTQPDAPAAQPSALEQGFTVLEVCRIARKATWQFLFLEKRVAKFEAAIDAFAEQTAPELLQSKDANSLLDDLRGFMDIRCNQWTNGSLADAGAMISYGILKRLLNREFPAEDRAGLHNSLLKGVGDVVSGAPTHHLWRLSRQVRADERLRELIASNDHEHAYREIQSNSDFVSFRDSFDQFLTDWGFRFSGELMLTTPSFQERPEALLEILRAYADLEGESPEQLLEAQTAARLEETAAVLQQLWRRKLLWPLHWPNKATLAAMVLKACHRTIALRERARLKQALLYSRCRRIALAIGERLVDRGFLGERDDVFFLTYAELESLLSGCEMFPHQTRDLVQLRKSAHRQLGESQPDDTLILATGEYLRDGPAPQTDSREEEDSSLTGLGVCGGSTTAPAAILKDVSEFRLLKKGDVLVTRQTDPGWGPVFFLIRGLVMERGGMLSHGAILAREYGIPTVVGVRDATRQIQHGQSICVNGDQGLVRIID